jgi:hypothetical protein
LVLLRLTAIESLPPKGWTVSHPRDRVDFVGPAQPERSESLTPLVASRLLTRHPELVCKCQDLLPRTPPRARLRKPEAPSTNRFHRLAKLSPSCNRVDRHWYRGSSPTVQLPTCVHAPTQGALDPTAYRLFTGAERPHAACQLLQCIVPRARHRPVRPPVEQWRTTFHQMAAFLSVRRQPGFLRSGVTWLASPRRPPPHATARAGGFTPT